MDRTEHRILEILRSYLKTVTITATASERDAESFFMDFFRSIPYYQENPELFGLHPIPDDPYERRVCWALRRGTGDDCVCLVHHYDTVGTADFKNLRACAFEPDALAEELGRMRDALSAEVQNDLASGRWLFAQGSCDMKGGGSIQLALMEQYAALPEFKGNVLLIAVPDEENLSAGMRGAIGLLCRLREMYSLRYRLMINSEPHQRCSEETGVFSFGSIGKMMAFVDVRGALSHAGKVFEGLNPVNILSEIVRRTELRMELSDIVGDECAPPPTWLYLKESKTAYDVSLPLHARGCLSVLNLKMTPQALLERLEDICRSSFEQVLTEMNDAWRRFCAVTGRSFAPLPWSVKLSTFEDLRKEAETHWGEEFRQAYAKKSDEIRSLFLSGTLPLIDCNFALVDFVCDYISSDGPRVIYGLVPPYYPSVCNLPFEASNAKTAGLYDALAAFTREEFGQEYSREYFFTGISDLSYTSLEDAEAVRATLDRSMPLFGLGYDLPLEEIALLSMPGVNIGPWGKDFHKLTERVYLEDLTERTPMILRHAISYILEGEGIL